MYELERPPHLRYAGPEDARCKRIGELHRYWLFKCRLGALPPRSAIDPSEIRALLPHIILVELDQDPFAIRYRLVGTAVAKIHRDDFTGRTHDSVTSLVGAGLEESYRRVLESKAPVFGRTGLDAGDGTWIPFEYAILPLSDDGIRVQRCLAIQCAEHPEPPILADAPH